MGRESFFSQLQSWFKADHAGRYLALILCEIGHYQPAALREILCDLWNIGCRSLPEMTLRAEYHFRGTKGTRRADIAVFAKPTDTEPIGLIEIKYRDRLTEETAVKPAQLVDYVAWANADISRRILVLSRETLDLGDVPARTWTQLAGMLRRRANGSELVALLVEHLEEEGIVMQNVDTRAVVGFVKRILCPWNGAGIQAGNLDGPTEFGKLLKNVQLLSDRFNGEFKRAWAEAGERHNGEDDPRGTKVASIDFDIYPRLKQKRGLADVFDEDGTVNNKARDGGEVDLYARHSLGSGHGWLRIGYGFRVEVDSSCSHEKERLPNAYVYAWANGQEIQRQGLDLVRQRKLSSFELITARAEESIDKVERLVRRQLATVLADLGERPELLTPKQRMAVRSLGRVLGRE